jgi:hypothetical protein
MDTAADEKEVTLAAKTIQRVYHNLTKLVVIEDIWIEKRRIE